MTVWDPNLDALVTELAMTVAAAVTNPSRNRRARALQASGYHGPVIVAEGDSWFCYPEIVRNAPADIITQLGREFVVYTEAQPGDVASAMRDIMTTPGGLLARLDFHRPDILMLSAGGNDLLGEGKLQACLLPGDRAIPDYFKTRTFSHTFWSVVDDIERILRAALARLPDLKAIIHGYDYAVPSGNGPWLRDPMIALGIPSHKHQAIVDKIVDWFNAALGRLKDDLNAAFGAERVFLVNLKNAVLQAQWHDELHPTTAGFATVCRRFRGKILQAHPVVA